MKMEVADGASARASGNNDSNNKWPAGLSAEGASAMSATSLLFAWLASRTLRRCGGGMDEEEVLPGLLWGLSPLIWAYLYSWTAALSPAPPNGTMFTCTACLLLVAAAADKLLAPVAGTVAIVVAPLFSACACGRALAERLQRAGGEPWSTAAVASTPIYQSRAEELEKRDHRVNAVFALKTMGFVVSVTMFMMAWTTPATEWEAPPTEVVFYLAGPLLLAARLMLPSMLGSPVLAAIDDMRFLAALVGVIGWLVVAVSAGVLLATIAGTVVVWLGELGMAGFLGYFLAVEAHYEKIMVIERRKPRRAKDVSGLLDGRESGDSCSAHIDGGDACSCRSQII